MEPKVIHATRKHAAASRSGWSYAGCGSFAQQSGCGNNWAQGFHCYGPQVAPAALEVVRREAEAADFLEGFLLLQSTAGGTGAGFGTFMAEALRDEFGNAALANCCVWPYETGEVPVQPYNTLLSVSHLVDVSDAVLLLHNEQLAATCSRLLGVKRPGFTDLNAVAASALAAALLPSAQRPPAGRSGGADARTAPLSISQARTRPASGGSTPVALPGAQPSCLAGRPLFPLADLCSHLCAHPRHRLLSLRAVPQLAAGSVAFTTFTWSGLLKRLRQMAITGSFLEEGLGWASTSSATCTAGGPAVPLHRYRNRALASTLVLRGQDAVDVDVTEFQDPHWHAPWALDPLMVAAHSARFARCQMAAALIANDQACVAPLRRMQDQAYAMLASRAYLHQYERCGLALQDMRECFTAVEETVAAYSAL